METITLATGRTRALIAPKAGGRIVQIETLLGGSWTPLLVAPDDLRSLLAQPLLWGCYPLAPWPGRIGQARFTWRGETYTMPANDGNHSIHGRGVYLPWTVREAIGDTCALELGLAPGDGWPFPAVLRQDLQVVNDGLRLMLAVENIGAEPFPAGLGWHPWFRRDVRPGVGPCVRVEATRHYRMSEDLIPTGEVAPPSGDADLGTWSDVTKRSLDDAYGAVKQPMEVHWGDLTLTITSSQNCRHVVVYTASDRGFCVEPQTCVPDAFNLAARGIRDTGMAVVEPGQILRAETSWQWRLG